jgi:xanthine dehydrogenase accessory factor
VAEAQAVLAESASRLATFEPEGQAAPAPVTVHLDLLRPDPTLLIIGAGHVAQPLATVGSLMGMRVLVVDDRAEWANRERFPTAAQIALVGYEPVHEILDPIPFPMTPATYVVVTTWGYDLPAMEQALQQNPAYIGLVASPTKARLLFQRMRQTGLPDQAIQRIRAPIGLDVGAENPGEIAVSILAEILTIMRGRTGQPLRAVRGGRIDALFAAPPAALPVTQAVPG